jgi:hypothetical protein
MPALIATNNEQTTAGPRQFTSRTVQRAISREARAREIGGSAVASSNF